MLTGLVVDEQCIASLFPANAFDHAETDGWEDQEASRQQEDEPRAPGNSG